MIQKSAGAMEKKRDCHAKSIGRIKLSVLSHHLIIINDKDKNKDLNVEDHDQNNPTSN